MLATTIIILSGLLGWYLWERSQRRTGPVQAGLNANVTLPHRQQWTLYHNAFSLCSKKTRVCLAELGITYDSRHIDLIETGSYENISRDFLRVNPAATVPVLLHNGHPIYESHEQIQYAAEHSPGADPLIPDDEQALAVMQHWVHKTSLIGDDPIAGMHQTAGNAVPGLTLPLFAAMIQHIPVSRILLGLLFHRYKRRPLLFLTFKRTGLTRLNTLKPGMRALTRSHAAMHDHLQELEAQLAESKGPWITGNQFTLADVGMMVILDRLREGQWLDSLLTDKIPNVKAYWAALQARPSYQAGCLDHQHALVIQASHDIAQLNQTQPAFWSIS